MQTAPLKFSDRSALGVSNEDLKHAMEDARVGIFSKSDKAMTHPEFQAWRDAGARVKDGVLANLDTLLERFEQEATKAGATVHWAPDAQAARSLVADLAKQHGCATAIKSKSMLCEEIKLNPELEKNDLDVLETDLGEYVVQLSEGRPSHIIAPIIHMTKDQVSEIFAKHHGPKDRSSKENIVNEARALLRPRMINADLGITGANFLVAKTGSVVLVTNEGNGRYCSTAPKVRITLAGIEKVLPSFAELALMLRLLPRAATGQTSSSYVSIGTGAAKQGRPHHHHIILVDNGRSKMLGNKYRKMLRCIRCGSCMNHCPVYKIAGGLSYDSVYTGPMGAVLSPNLLGQGHDELPHAATMCSACSFACPVKIPLPDLMRQLREDQIAEGKQPLQERWAFNLWLFFAQRPLLYASAVTLASKFLRWRGKQTGKLSELPFGASWFNSRDISIPETRPFRTTLENQVKNERT